MKFSPTSVAKTHDGKIHQKVLTRMYIHVRDKHVCVSN